MMGSATPLDGDERILLDVVEALRGAENLRDRLLTALQTGTPSVADLAYAVKARIKEDYKAIDKIKERRSGTETKKPRADYCVSDVTDLVGLRIVTLYRLDVLEVIETLLETISADTSSSAPFVAGSISEVKIFSTNTTGDVQALPQQLVRLFERHGLSEMTSIEEKPSNYSSIHILVMGRGKYRDEYREIPVEIQIRTALEDVWGQIEHTLKYKRKRLDAAGGESHSIARLATTLSHLGALKTMIDGIAQYGDQIKLQIDELEPELGYTGSRTAEPSETRLNRLAGLPNALREEINAAVAHASPALSESLLAPSARIRTLRMALARLEQIAADPLIAGLAGKNAKEAGYVVDMQRALIHFQIGNLIDEGDGHIQKAASLYQVLEVAHPRRLVVSYRLARTLDALGGRQDAISKLRDVVVRLDQPREPTPADHWIRAAAPRLLGVLLWEECRARCGNLGEIHERVNDDVLALLREAYQFTLKAYEASSAEGANGSGPSEHQKSANNLLYYLLEYLEAGGAAGGGMDCEALEQHLQEMGGDRPELLETTNAADTVRRAHAYLGNPQLEFAAAQRLVELAGRAGPPRTPFERETIRLADRTIELSRGKFDVPDAHRQDLASGADVPVAEGSPNKDDNPPVEDNAGMPAPRKRRRRK